MDNSERYLRSVRQLRESIAGSVINTIVESTPHVVVSVLEEHPNAYPQLVQLHKFHKQTLDLFDVLTSRQKRICSRLARLVIAACQYVEMRREARSNRKSG